MKTTNATYFQRRPASSRRAPTTCESWIIIALIVLWNAMRSKTKVDGVEIKQDLMG
jgi:hypothetical protein